MEFYVFEFVLTGPVGGQYCKKSAPLFFIPSHQVFTHMDKSYSHTSQDFCSPGLTVLLFQPLV